tara:strand:+ start:45 stop:392 length:348 start_codon:yes stop_codon:yes gene_type:complete
MKTIVLIKEILTANIKYCFYILMIFFLASCSTQSPHWKRADTSHDQWSLDEIECRSKANNLTEKEFKKSSYVDMIERNSHEVSFSSHMQKFDTRRTYKKLFSKCLIKLGYRKKAE